MTETNAQLESSKWVFGYGVGVDFTSGQPIAFSGSKIRTSEGCSTVSNNKGELLFYTDGISVWNKRNELMPNGKKLNGHLSSTQSAIIVPLPGNNSIQYIFTMDSEANKGGFCFSIVDLTKERGLGNVTLKNQPIKAHCTEKLVAVRHENDKDIWIVIHEYGSDAFMAYLLTKDGLNLSPVVSNIGLKYDKSVFNTIGYIKISTDNKKIAVAINGDKTVQLFDFDRKSGILSKQTTLRFNSDSSPYGIEFSPSSALLYIGIVTKGLVYQANLSAGNEQAIQKSLCIVGQNRIKNNLGALQLGVDGKIYIAEYQSKYLSAIDKPNTLGTECHFKVNAVFLNDNICMFGLPTFFQDYVKQGNFNEKTQVFNKNTNIEINKKYILNSIYFDFNKALLRDSSIIELQKLIDVLAKNPNLHIEITGHTDSIGSLRYNKELSLARARKIGSYIAGKGIKKSRIKLSGKSSIEPIAPNTDEAGRQKNRRVEFILKNI
jgi:outer membrane protein OmpA-like peptidoglycan-associated protein